MIYTLFPKLAFLLSSFLILISLAFSKKILKSTNVIESDSFCAFPFYNANGIESISSESDCVSKNPIYQNITIFRRVVLVSSYVEENLNNLFSLYDYVYEDLLVLMRNESRFLSQFYQTSLTIFFSNETHFVGSEENPQKDFFRRNFVNLTMKPLYCDENSFKFCKKKQDPSVTIVLKSSFKLFISYNLKIIDLEFNGNDLAISRNNLSFPCFLEKQICCSELYFMNIFEENSNDLKKLCGLNLRDINYLTQSSLNNGIFNLEIIYDIQPSLITLPKLNIINCKFTNIWILDQKINSFISIQALGSIIHIENTTFTNFFAYKGIIYIFDPKQLGNFYFSTEWESIFSNETFNEILIATSYIASINNSFENRYFDYNFQGEFIVNFFNLNVWKNPVYLSFNTFQNINNIMKKIQLNVLSLFSNHNIVRFDNILFVNITNLQFLQFSYVDFEIFMLNLKNISITDRKMMNILNCNVSFQSSYFEQIFSQIVFYFESSFVLFDKFVINSSQNIAIKFIQSIAIIRKFECFNSNSTYEGVFYFQQTNLYLISFTFLNFIGQEHILEFVFCDEVVIKEGYANKLSSKSIIMSVNLLNLSFFSCYFIESVVTNLINTKSAIKSIIFMGNIFIDLNISVFIGWITTLIYCYMENNYFLRINYMESDFPFQIFQGEWNMIGNVWEKNIFNDYFTCLLDLEICNSFALKNSFLFAELPDPEKENLCYWHSIEVTCNENNFIYESDSFLKGIVTNEDSQKSFTLKKNNFILINIPKTTNLGAIAIFTSGTQNVHLQDNFFANLKCKSFFEVKFTMGIVNIQGASSFAKVSNIYQFYAKNNSFFNCSCLYGGSMSVLNYNQTYIEQTNVNLTKAEILGGFLSIFNCYNFTIKDLTINQAYSPKGSCIYAENSYFIEINNIYIQNSIGTNSGSIEARRIGLLRINELKIKEAFSKYGSFICLFYSTATIANTVAYKTSSTLYGGAIFIDSLSSLIIEQFFGKDIYSYKSGGFVYLESGKNFSLRSAYIENSIALGNGAALFINNMAYVSINNLIVSGCITYSNGILFLSSINKAVSIDVDSIICIGNQASSGSCIFYSMPSNLNITNITCIKNNGTILKFYYVYSIWVRIFEGKFIENFCTIKLLSLFVVENILLVGENLVFLGNTVFNSLLSFVESQANITNATFFRALTNFEKLTNSLNNQVINSYNSLVLLDKIYFNSNLSDMNFSAAILYFISAQASSTYLSNSLIKDNNYVQNSLIKIGNSYANFDKCLFFNNTGPVITLINSFLDFSFSFFENNQAKMADICNEIEAWEIDSIFDLFTKITLKNVNIKIIKGVSSCFSLINFLEIENSFFIGDNINENNKAALKFKECSNISILNCTFLFTKSPQGSSLNIFSLEAMNALDIKYSSFIVCEGDEGGAIFLQNFGKLLTISIISNIFIKNLAKEIAACLCIRSQFDNSSFVLYKNSFINNTAKIAPTIYSEIFEVKKIESNIFIENNDYLLMTKNVTTAPYALNILCLNSSNSCNNVDEVFEIKSGVNFNLSVEIIDSFGQKLMYDSSSISLIKTNIMSKNSVNIKQIQNFMTVAEKGVFTFEKLAIFSLPNMTFQTIISVIVQDLFFKQKEVTRNLVFFVKPCNIGEIFNANFKCQRCNEGFYTLLAGSSSNHGLCLQCPDKSICPGGDIVIPQPGYWRMSKNSLYFVECQNPDYCIGLPVGVSYQSVKTNYQTILKNYPEIYKGTCLRGHEKNLCQECIVGYGKYLSGGDCVICREYDVLIFIRLIGIFMLLIIYLLFTTHQMINFNQSSIVDEVSKIYINHFQRISLIILLDLNKFIVEVKDFFSFLNTLSFFTDDIFSNDCVAQKLVSENHDDKLYFVKVLINYMVPFIISLSCLFLIILRAIYFNFFRKIKTNITNQRKSIYLKKLSILILIAVFLFYPLLTKCSLSLLNCISLDESNNLYMYSSPNLLCWGSTHVIFFFCLGLSGMFIFGIGFPAILFYIIKSHKSFLRKISGSSNNLKSIISKFKAGEFTSHETLKNKELNEKIRKEMEMIGVYRFFYKDYKGKFYYWESIIFGQKFLLTLVQNLNQLIPFETKNYCFFLILVVYLIFLLKCNSFRKKYINNLEVVSVYIAILTKLFFILSNSMNINYSMKILFMVCQLCLNITFLVISFCILVKYGNWKATLIKILQKMKLLKETIKKKSVFVEPTTKRKRKI